MSSKREKYSSWGAARFQIVRSVISVFALPAALLLLTAPRAAAIEAVDPGESVEIPQYDECSTVVTFSNAFKGTSGQCKSPFEVETAAFLSVLAFNNDVSSYATAFAWLFVPSVGTATVLDATVSADVEWRGVLFGAGLGGAGAKVEIEMSFVDAGTGATKGSIKVAEESQNSIGIKGVDIGGTIVSGSKRVTFDASVVRGNFHLVRLTVRCSAQSGLVGLDVGCVFQDEGGITLGLGVEDRYVRASNIVVTVEQDEVERLDRIETKLEGIESKIDGLKAGQEALAAVLALIQETQADIVRLLGTPPGRR